jgi:hypothetical protein
MNPTGTGILDSLHIVAAERAARAADAALGTQVLALKAFQHERFARTYADVLRHPRFAPGARFFLDDLYGPGDFTQRDAQFARIVPALVRLFPQEIVRTVLALSQLHALSEQLDTAMGRALVDASATSLDAATYATAWRAVGRAEERERQVMLTLAIGTALDRYTRNPLLRHTLRVMRGPAHAAGLGALQGFLERGFDTFRDMRGAGEFLDLVALRERALTASMFAGGVPEAMQAGAQA